jgi:hypothetical protein
MPQTLIQNQGVTETIINDNNQLLVNRTNWGANYDGDKANILVDTNTNGKHNVYKIELDNEDLAKLLNIPSVDTSLDKRLLRDFNRTKKIKNRAPTPYIIEFDKNDPMTHVSSPLPNQELVSIERQQFGTRRSKRRRKHKSYKMNRRTKRRITKSHRNRHLTSRRSF